MNFVRRATILALAIALTPIGDQLVLAETIVYRFTGAVTSVSDPLGSLAGQVW